MSENAVAEACPYCKTVPIRKEMEIWRGEKRWFNVCRCDGHQHEREEKERDRLRKVAYSKLPERLQSETMENWQTIKGDAGNENLLAFWKRFKAGIDFNLQRGKSFLLIGPYGCGKTKIASDLFKAAVNVGKFGRYYNCTDIKFDLRAWVMDAEAYQRNLETLRTVDVLFLDDIGQSKLPDNYCEFFYAVINYRYENVLPTYLTSHCNLKELEGVIGPEVVSRIKEMTGDNLVACSCMKDFRAEGR